MLGPVILSRYRYAHLGEGMGCGGLGNNERCKLMPGMLNNCAATLLQYLRHRLPWPAGLKSRTDRFIKCPETS